MTANNNNNHRGEFLRCLSEIFKRDLLSIPVVKKFPHTALTQRSGLRATTIELDTAAYPNIEYVAGTRLSVYPLNSAGHVQAIMRHLVDDVGPPAAQTPASNGQAAAATQHRVMVEGWSKFVRLNGRDSLRLALTHLFDIETAPSRELIKLLADSCRERAERKRLVAIGQTNESWEKWICSGHRTLRSLLEEDCKSCKVQASVVLNELNLQQPRQYSISNIKSAKRFRAEIIVVQHRFSLRQIELNLRQLRDRELYEQVVSPTGSPPPTPPPPSATSQTSSPQPLRPPQTKSTSRSTSQRKSPGSGLPAGHKSSSTTPPRQQQPQQARSPSRSPTRSPTQAKAAVAASPATAARVASSKGSRASNRSIRSTASFASSPITTHQVRRVSSFSGPLMSAYANASSSTSSLALSATGAGGPASSTLAAAHASALEKSKSQRRSLLSVLESQNKTINSETGATTTTTPEGAASGQATARYEGLCSNYLLDLGANEHLLCEFVENPRFTLKGNRERPIMMIGQDVGMIAFRPFWQQRHLEHDRAQVFYSLFKDLSPKKFGDMQLVCLTGHRGRIEDLFKHEISSALASKILGSYCSINRKHLLNLLSAATSKSQLLLSQLQQRQQQHPTQSQAGPSAVKSTMAQQGTQNLAINSRELLELGDKIYKLLVENNGCLYTCCDPHMTQAIEILTFESIARNNSHLTRERLMKLLPKWKGRTTSPGQTGSDAGRSSTDIHSSVYTLENTYERAQIVQEIYDSSI